jgi:CRISPR-associated endonuclease Cas3-HD
LEPEQAPDFFAALPAAAAFHDWGKASSSFEDAILHGKQQLIRHEHLSALMLAADSARQWLQTAPILERNGDVILSAVVTHHLKARDHEHFAPRVGDQTIFRLLIDRADFARLLELIERRLGLGGPRPTFPAFWNFEEGRGTFYIEPLREQVRRRLKSFGGELRGRSELRRLNTAVRPP